ncbi:transcriptional regulator [Paenibacillus sp. LC231]|uniref:PLDc N-terminal domain-containing protein n=1 Tax=Paenibacillus TaxID=44249 RepID=UPI0008DE15DA|nr:MULTISPECIES: PLDc N-terminal domain-containing protein [Paenibacillus]MBX4146155.1 PLDc N-terminal domain-containing protein [Paenibacillus lautus]OIB03181.1 transcriptional regulator [Paenibacillus sp. LC231]RAR39418.1 transcriptional regulator [Paenibacillus sp. MDMC362]
MEINWGLIWPILALQAILAVTGLISLFRAEPANIRGPRWVWVLIILLGNLLGSVAYFVAGRREA